VSPPNTPPRTGLDGGATERAKLQPSAADAPSSGAAPNIPAPNARLLAFFGTRAGHRALTLITDYFHATLRGDEHIPRQGGALIVSNHALFALDTAVLGALLVRDIGRNPRFLADRKLWEIPGLHQLITAIGALPGEPHAAQTLLKRGELVVVYPGGVDDSLKLDEARYRLQWKTRAGFARVALAARTPIIPVVGLGIDEMYSVRAREHFVGRRIFGSARYDLPLAFGAFGTLIPRRVKQTYIALPPIAAVGDPQSPEDVERIRAATYEAIDAHLRLVR
jgi:1-acyl-sn-glycerol-3-phosphate acyltransferase